MRLRSLAREQSSKRRPARGVLRVLPAPLAVALLVWALPAVAYELPTFTPMEVEANVDDLYSANGTYGPGVAVVDIDETGHKFYRNDGTGHFTDIAAEVGLQFTAVLPPEEERAHPTEMDYTSMMPCFVDTDSDGDKDFFLTGWNTWCRFFENVSTVDEFGELQLEFVERTAESGLDIVGRSATAAWGDYNRDGRPDVYIADWGGFDHLFRGNGDNTWREVSDRARLYDDNPYPQPGWSAIWFDHNDDGWPDLYVGNDYGLPNFFYVSDTVGAFVDRREEYFTEFSQNVGAAGYNATMGQALCDYDHDGDYDMFVANSLENNLYLNTGGVFDDQLVKKELMGPGDALVELDDHNIGWFCDFPDLDLDGHEDLFLVNGFIRICVYDDPDNPDCGGEGQPDQPNLLWMNQGDGSFDRVTAAAGLYDLGWGKSGAFADFDMDGDLDLFVTNSYGPAAPGSHRFWRNDTETDNDWLIVKLVGDDQNGRNLDALGAEVEVTAGGTTWRRLRTASTGYLSYTSPELHFGLGQIDRIDQVRVKWANGDVDLVEDVAANRRMTIVQGQGLQVPALVAPALSGREVDGRVRLSWEMPRGVDFDRFLVQRVAGGGMGGTLAVVRAEPGQLRYEYVDDQVEPGQSYRYRLTVAQGDLQVQGDEVSLVVGAMARRVELRPASPNPFNPRTELRWRVAPGTEHVRLRLLDLRGRLVREFDPPARSGWNSVVWDGTDHRGRQVASGNYRFVVEADGQAESTSLTLVR